MPMIWKVPSICNNIFSFFLKRYSKDVNVLPSYYYYASEKVFLHIISLFLIVNHTCSLKTLFKGITIAAFHHSLFFFHSRKSRIK